MAGELSPCCGEQKQPTGRLLHRKHAWPMWLMVEAKGGCKHPIMSQVTIIIMQWPTVWNLNQAIAKLINGFILIPYHHQLDKDYLKTNKPQKSNVFLSNQIGG